MTRTFALCLSAIVWMWASPLPLILSQAHAEEPAAAPAVEILPAETIKLHEFEPDTLGPFVNRVLGEYRKGAEKGALWCDFSGSIVKKGAVENYRMNCEIRLDASILQEAGKRLIPPVLVEPSSGSYSFRQGFIYPLPFGELYRVEDLTRSDKQGDYAVLKRVTRKELGIDTPVDYSRIYIPIHSPEIPGGWGGVGLLYCRFWYAEEPDIYTKKLQTVLKCSLSYPKVIPSDEELFPIMGSMTVAEGNILPVVDCGYKILKIVPPNVEKKVCGWVEIDPRPILLRTPLGRQLEKLEQLEKQKAPPQPPLAPIPESKP